jgi:hypothetical protein
VKLALESFGLYFQRNLSLASRRDCPVKPGYTTASAGLDLLDFQRCIPAVKDPKIVAYHFSLGYLLKVMGGFLHLNDRCCGYFTCGLSRYNPHHKDKT